nr:translesion DNA synthesis-associated protein ImuA [uncultured Albidiferax sp.]
MNTLPAWSEDTDVETLAQAMPRPSARLLPKATLAAMWRGTELGTQVASVVSSGWEVLDHELPGHGWPCQSLTEVLTPQPGVLEWRLLGPALRKVVAGGSQVILVAPPKQPYLPGLVHEGLDQKHLVWIQVDTPAHRLWVTEQLIKSNAAGAVIAWLPQARQEQIRRLQVQAQGCDGLVFLCRPEAAQHEASAAPLRMHARYGLDWQLQIQVFKRRGPVHAGQLDLPSFPGGLSSILTPRLMHPSRMVTNRETPDAVGGLAPRRRSVRPVATH